MKSGIKKVLLSTLALFLTVMLIAGLAEVVEMSGGPTVAASVLASAGDPEPSSGDDGGGSSSSGGSSISGGGSSSSQTSSGTKKASAKKKANPITVKGKTASVSVDKLAKGSVTVARKKAMSLSKAKGKVTYKKLKGNKKITINKTSGKIKLKRGLKKGVYKVKIKVRAAGTSKYKPRSRTTTVTVRVVGKANTLRAAGKTVEISKESLDGANVIIKNAQAMTITNPQGAVSYRKVSGNGAIAVNGATGDITVGKGLAEGTYAVQVSVSAAGNSKYESNTVVTTVTVVVKAAETPDPEAGGN